MRPDGTTRDVAIIGDNFMLPERFEQAIHASCDGQVATRTMRLPWPDTPMEHGYATAGLEGLKEYQGDPDEVVRFVSDAEVLVTQLAPVSASMLERMPRLKLVAVSRGGPVNVDIAAARARGVRVVNTPGRNASAVAEFTVGAILSQTRLITAGHESLRAGRVARRPLSRRPHRTRAVGDGRCRDRLRPDRDAPRQAAEAVRLPHPGLRSLRPGLGDGPRGRGGAGRAWSRRCAAPTW